MPVKVLLISANTETKITAGLRIYPHTQWAETAAAEGVIREGDDLLWPRFYVAPGLEEWLPARMAACRATRPWEIQPGSPARRIGV